MENIKETIAKLEKGLDNPYITDDIKVKISEKIAELKAELEPKPAPIPEPIAVVETKVEPTLDDLTKRLAIVTKMAKKDPNLKARVKIIEKMIEKAKKGVISHKSKIKIGDIVANKKHKTIGIVRDIYGGEFRTDADGVVDIDDLEIYSPSKHNEYHIAPSTKKEITETIGYKIVKTLGGFGDGLSDEKAILDSYSDIIPQLTRAAAEPFDRVELQKLIVKITGNPDVSSDLEILRKHKVLDLDKKEIEDEKVSDETIKAAEFYFSDKYNLTKYDLYEDLVRYVQMEKDFNAKKLTPKDIIGTGIKPQYAREIASKWIKDRLELTKYLIKNFDDKNQLTETQKQEQHFDEPTSEKLYSIQNNIGKSKYVVNYHDGVKKHKDGSPFYDIEIFKNKKELENFVKKLEKEGYKEKYENGGEISANIASIRGLIKKAVDGKEDRTTVEKGNYRIDMVYDYGVLNLSFYYLDYNHPRFNQDVVHYADFIYENNKGILELFDKDVYNKKGERVNIKPLIEKTIEALNELDYSVDEIIDETEQFGNGGEVSLNLGGYEYQMISSPTMSYLKKSYKEELKNTDYAILELPPHHPDKKRGNKFGLFKKPKMEKGGEVRVGEYDNGIGNFSSVENSGTYWHSRIESNKSTIRKIDNFLSKEIDNTKEAFNEQQEARNLKSKLQAENLHLMDNFGGSKEYEVWVKNYDEKNELPFENGGEVNELKISDLKKGDLLKKKGSNLEVEVLEVGNDWRSGHDYAIIESTFGSPKQYIDVSDFVLSDGSSKPQFNKGGEIKKEDIEILGVPRNKISEKEWKSILSMAKYQNGATYLLKDENGLDVKPLTEYEWYVKDKFEKGGSVWIQKATKQMEKKGTKGLFTERAEARGLTAVEFAKKVLANPNRYTKTIQKEAQFVKNTNPELFN